MRLRLVLRRGLLGVLVSIVSSLSSAGLVWLWEHPSDAMPWMVAAGQAAAAAWLLFAWLGWWEDRLSRPAKDQADKSGESE